MKISAVIIALSLLCGCAAPRLIGTVEGDSMIFTNRQQWDKDFNKYSIGKKAYRLGDDIAVFVGSKGFGRADTLYMCSVHGFSEDELAQFPSAAVRRDIPPRNHEVFARLDVNRGWQANPGQQPQ